MVTAVSGLVERDEELAVLRAACGSSAGQIVLVEGESGSGKTELIRAAIADAREQDATDGVLAGACDGLEIPTAFAPFYEMLGELPGEIASMITTEAAPLAVYAAMLDLLRNTPTVLVIDDVQWADAATIGLLRYLGRRMTGTRGTLVIALRSDEFDETGDVSALIAEIGPAALRIALRPFSEAAIRTLADDPTIDAGALLSTSGGNPFFVVELLREPDVDVPRTIGEVITARLRRLPLGAQRLVEGIALCPDGLELDLALQLSVDANRHIDKACTVGLLTIERDRVRCRHDIVRTSAERSIGPVRRRELHTQLASLLEPRAAGPADVARLAGHYAGAGDGTKTVEYSLRAAADAQRAGTHRQAADHFARVLAFPELIPADRLDDVLRSAAAEFDVTGDVDGAVTVARQRTGHAVDGPTSADALADLSGYLLNAGDRAEAVECAEECLRVVAPDDARTRAIAARLLARVMMVDGDWNLCVVEADMALEAARSSGDVEVEARALCTAGTAHAGLGQPIGLGMLREAFELAAAHDCHDAAAGAINNLASSYTSFRRVDEARIACRAGIEFCDARELDAWTVSMRGALARIELLAGNTVGARTHLATAKGPAHCWGGDAEAAMVGALIEMRSNGVTASDIDDVLVAHDRANDSWTRLDACMLAGEAAWHGVTDERAFGERYDALLGDAAFATDMWGCAQVLFWSTRLGLPLPPAHPEPLPLPLELELTGDIAGAASEWDGLGCPFEAAIVRIGMAEPPIDEITASLTTMGALFTLDVARRTWRERGVDVSMAPERVHPSGLTPRQLDVLTLLDDGLSNADISDRLFISEKTAGHHVSAILTAFGVPSRAGRLSRTPATTPGSERALLTDPV